MMEYLFECCDNHLTVSMLPLADAKCNGVIPPLALSTGSQLPDSTNHITTDTLLNLAAITTLIKVIS